MVFDKENPVEKFFTQKKDDLRPIIAVYDQDMYFEHDGTHVLFGSIDMAGFSVKTLEAILEVIENDNQ